MKTLLLSLLFAPALAWSVALERVPGTHVSLAPPAGFEPATRFQGFVKKDVGASILVNEIPSPFSAIQSSLTSTELTAKEMKLLGRQAVKLGDRDGVLLHVSQQAYGSEFRKWILIFGDQANTVMLVATVPIEQEKDLEQPMKASLLTTTWNQGLQLGFWEGVGFSVDEKPDLKRAKKLGTTVVLTESGRFPKPSQSEAAMVVGSLVSPRLVVKDKKAYTKQALEQMQSLQEFEILDEKDVEVDGLHGNRILAYATNKNTGDKRFVLFAMLYDDGAGYYRFAGVSSAAQRGRYEKEFNEVLQSFRRVETP